MVSKGNHKKQRSQIRLFGSFLILLLVGCAGRYFEEVYLSQIPTPFIDLKNIEFREAWYGVVFNGEKVGFTHLKLNVETQNLFKIECETVLRFKILGIIGKDISSKEIYFVNPDFTLSSFNCKIKLNGAFRKVKGEVAEKNLEVSIETENSKDIQLIKLDENIYPGVAMYFYPLLNGIEIGKVYNYQVYHPETLTLEKVSQEVISYERSTLFEGAAFKIKNTLGGMTSECWISPEKGMLLEMGFHGIIIFDREDENSAKEYLYRNALAKNDLFLDFSLVKTDRPIPHPREVKYLVIEIKGIDDERLIIEDSTQKAVRDGDVVRYYLNPTLPDREPLELPNVDQQLRVYCRPSLYIQSSHHEIVAKADTILKGERSTFKAVKMLTKWVAQEVKDSLVDTFSALDVLHKKEGDCQAHTYLYTALARAAGIPTKVVSGLVYMEDYGFLYHSWAESYTGDWIPVDPTFGQVPVDATHIKLVEGEQFEDLSKLVNIMGRLQAKVAFWK